MVRILIKDIRISKNMSIRKLAELSSVSKTYISEVENGKKSPTLDILCKIAKALDTNVKSLFVECEDDMK